MLSTPLRGGVWNEVRCQALEIHTVKSKLPKSVSYSKLVVSAGLFLDINYMNMYEREKRVGVERGVKLYIFGVNFNF